MLDTHHQPQPQKGTPLGYDKPWKDYRAQLAQLQARGMAADDPERAIDYLHRIGYYRLSGYWFAFRERSGKLVLLDENGRKPKKVKEETLALDSFRPGTRFHDVVDLYVFDKRLRMLVLDAVERIEVAMRVEVSHTLGQLDTFAHLRPDLLHEDFAAKMHPDVCLTQHHQWCTKQAQLIGRSREEFVKHNKAKYGLPLAIWVACEVWDFGTMSTLYNGMRVQEQDEIAGRFGLSNGRIFATWLRGLNYLRNVCAHHSRLWNRNVIDQPKLPPVAEVAWVDSFDKDARLRARSFLLLCLCRHVLRVVNPRSTWPERVKEHLLDFPNLDHVGLNLSAMGVPDNWIDIWQHAETKNPSAVAPLAQQNREGPC